ncbi:gag-pol polyprotein [Trifolium medium]|uniref:Gag-pol polyprotein n=1 Tax=Trifolium medium TaxID=97028 RepID=A0A392PDN2_9FABA|nr:gag-pol polyprotein [Trifolium medium]
MCVDFTDLNKACPKDPYPLPSIDRLIDGASGFKTLSFMDAYSGYNKIKMNTLDAPHTAFMSNTCNYHYKVMPFGLKNAGATKVFIRGPGRKVFGIHAHKQKNRGQPGKMSSHNRHEESNVGKGSSAAHRADSSPVKVFIMCR